MEIVNLKYALCNPNAVPPMYAHEGDSGFDLFSTDEKIALEPHERRVFKTGLRIELPKGYELQIRPTSGISSKTNFTIHFGTVDNGYRGEVGVIVENSGNFTIWVEKGAKLAQAIVSKKPFVKFQEIQERELSLTSRNKNGFGSTEKNY